MSFGTILQQRLSQSILIPKKFVWHQRMLSRCPFWVLYCFS